MTTVDFGDASDSSSRTVPSAEVKFVRCHVLVERDDDDTVSLIVLNLPGAGTSGGSEAEALAYLGDAVRETIASYDEGVVPWQTNYEVPAGAETRWIQVELNG